jgi:hypothetical protein
MLIIIVYNVCATLETTRKGKSLKYAPKIIIKKIIIKSLGEPARLLRKTRRRAIRCITFTPSGFGGSAAIPLAALRRKRTFFKPRRFSKPSRFSKRQNSTPRGARSAPMVRVRTYGARARRERDRSGRARVAAKQRAGAGAGSHHGATCPTRGERAKRGRRSGSPKQAYISAKHLAHKIFIFNHINKLCAAAK